MTATPKNAPKKAIVYIDGFNLYYGIRAFGQRYKWLDVQALAQSFLINDSELLQVKFFTARLNGNSKQKFRQSNYLLALQKHCQKLTIIEGYFAKARKCKHCKGKNNEEKQTDVNIACEMLADSYTNRFDVAYLVSGDSDLVMPVRHMHSMGKIIIIASPPTRKSQALKQAASGEFNISENRLRHCQLPHQIPTKRGFLSLPAHWKMSNQANKNMKNTS